MHCGIDFGTSNTTLSIKRSSSPELVALEDGQTILPSALFFPADKQAKPLFGRAAIGAYLNGDDGRFMRSLKRVLGTTIMQSGTLINDKRYQFGALIGLFLRHIKTIAEKQTGETLTSVTLGRPVHFQDCDPAADMRAERELRDIATSIGFDQISFQYEPIAGALSHETSLTSEQLALVIDIGGGTSDFSVIRLGRTCLSPHYTSSRNRKSDILANTGIRIGGNDCDKTINLHAAMPLLGLHDTYGEKSLEIPSALFFDLSEWSKIMFCYTPHNKNWVRQMIREAHAPEKLMRLATVLDDQLAHKILNVSEQAKIDLSTQQETRIAYDFLDLALHASLTQHQMNTLFDRILSPVTDTMHACLQQANVTADQIGALILTGGSTALPFFQNLWRTHFPHAQLLNDNKLGSMGLGLCLS